MYRGQRVGVVVPAYNEEVLIGETLKGIPDFVDRVYVVDDGSKDGTARVVREFMERDPRITLIRHEQNQGVGKSIIDGYKAALAEGVDVVAVMAGDNQMDPAYLPDLLDPIVEGKADYTKGNRLNGPEYVRNMPKLRFLGNILFTLLTKISSGYWHVMDTQNGYTAISRRALEGIPLDRVYTGYGYPNDILVQLNVHGFRVRDVLIPARYGREKSKIRYGRYTARLLWIIFNGFIWRIKEKYLRRSFHPLVFFYALGLVFLSLGVWDGAFALYQEVLSHHAASRLVRLLPLMFSAGFVMFFFGMLLDMWEGRRDGLYAE